MAPYSPRIDEVAPGVVRVADTCNVYVLRSDRDAVLVDFGSGAVLDRLDEIGIDRVTDVLVTHHHRDQVQGLARAVDAGARVWVPPHELELFTDIERRWSSRPVANDYDLREDRFSLLYDVAVSGTVDEYRTRRYGDFDVYTLPTPGHTIGSVTYLATVAGRLLAFSGDVAYAGGRVWSLAATQWSYSGVEGQAATIVSCGALAERAPDVLLPAHGDVEPDPAAALALTQRRLQELLELRLGERWDLDAWLHRPWQQLTPHLLRNRTCFATSYALLSDSGSALLIDWGYDQTVGTIGLSDRFARRPLLTSLETLRRDFGVERVEVVVTTHYHDDHVAGINLLRDVEGTQVWAPENVAPVIEQPHRYDLPCLWFDAVPVDRVLEHETPIAWREHTLTTHALPGHTLYAAAISFDVDGRRVLATGDQQGDGPGPDARGILNYQYRNRFRFDDFVASAALYRRLRPDLVLSGHWQPREVTEGWLEQLAVDGQRVADLHRELLPVEDVDLGGEGFVARIAPYRARVAAGDALELDVTVRNPFAHEADVRVALTVPREWRAEPAERDARVPARDETTLAFRVTAAGAPVERARVAADVTVDGTRFGQHAEALVDVV